MALEWWLLSSERRRVGMIDQFGQGVLSSIWREDAQEEAAPAGARNRLALRRQDPPLGAGRARREWGGNCDHQVGETDGPTAPSSTESQTSSRTGSRPVA